MNECKPLVVGGQIGPRLQGLVTQRSAERVLAGAYTRPLFSST